MVNYSRSPIPQVKENKKQYTSRDVKISNRTKRFQNIIIQPVKRILHEVDNNILQNLPTTQEDDGVAEYIYGPSVPYL